MYCWLKEPNTCRAMAAKDGHGKVGHIFSGLCAEELEQLDVRTVALPSLITLV
jgi:hypothetical protein